MSVNEKSCGPYVAWLGCMIHTKSFTEFQILTNGLLIVDASGTIVEFCELESAEQFGPFREQYALQESQVS